MCLLIVACAPGEPAEGGAAGETRRALELASGVTRADSGASHSEHRIVPLGPMKGDVELLYGDPEASGKPFVMRIRELPGTRVPPHSHPVDEHITVVEGSWFFALGEAWDSTALRELKAGAYAFAPAGSTMFGYAPDGAVVQVHGVGPFHIRWREAASTLDDPGAGTRFALRKGERVRGARGGGTIRQGYASGAIVQYEIQGDSGSLFMADEKDLRRD